MTLLRRDSGPAGNRASTQRRRYIAVVIAVLLLTAGLRMFVVEPLRVASDSMEPTVGEGSTVLLFKQGSDAPGALVAFNNPVDSKLMIKRIVAVGGQSIAIKDALLYVDGALIPEPFVDHSRIDGTYFGPVTVPEGQVFLMGDNRDVSVDSREFGAVPSEDITAVVIWPMR
ncbi:signal peptidase I [Arthrobacter sp. H5]|uniref:signal peptidase I n=1 Tax=Arthrobacter sp. H5 TaxID=1267973 RepID=UPI0004B5DF7C|nr:signal peptidase I [Arthrobacter sp. H5]